MLVSRSLSFAMLYHKRMICRFLFDTNILGGASFRISVLGMVENVTIPRDRPIVSSRRETFRDVLKLHNKF